MTCLIGISYHDFGQVKTGDINRIDITKFIDLPSTNFQTVVTESYAFTISFNNYSEWNKQDKSIILFSLSDDLSYNLDIERKNYKFCSNFRHQLGFQYLPDSVINKTIDATSFYTKTSFPLTKVVHFTLNTDSRMTLLNSYQNIYNDSTHQNEKKLKEGFMTPAQFTLSGGFDIKGGKLGSLNIGLTSAKFIYIHNQAVFTDMKTDLFYGVKKNKKILFEYGLSTELIFVKEFSNSIKWNCNIKAFKNFNMPIDLNIRNEFSIIFGNSIKSSIQTLIEYEKLKNKALQFENIVTIGFYLGKE